MSTPRYVVVTGMALAGFMLGQSATPVAEPPIPADPLELVATAQPVQDVNQRAEILNLMIAAHRRSNVREQPYD